MSSATENAAQIRQLILELFSHAGDGDYRPENAHEFEDDDLELSRQKHSLYAYSMLSNFPPQSLVINPYKASIPWFR